MIDEYVPRCTVPLPRNCGVTLPEALPELVHDQDPATTVFTDFHREHPVTIGAGANLDQALDKLRHSGTCIMLVNDEDERVVGEIAVEDLIGEKPVRLVESTGMHHNQLTVGMLMTPRDQVKVLEMNHLTDARVGHIIATLHALERRHVLVVDNGNICGLFSAGQISRQLGRTIVEEEVPPHSLADMVHGHS